MGPGSRASSASEPTGADLPPAAETSAQPGLVTFAFPGPLREKLVAAVLSGKKTATTGLAIEWEVEGEALPVIGQLHTVVDSNEQPVGVIETTSVEVIRLGDVDQRVAHDEGEDFHDVTHWRVEHERFWNDEVIPTLPAGVLTGLTDDTQVLVWRFRLAATR